MRASSGKRGNNVGPSDSAPWTFAELPDLVERVMPAVVTLDVQLEDASGNGSGFAVPAGGGSAPGVLLTNAHVVLDTAEVVVVFADDETCKPEILLVEPSFDLAILGIGVPPPATLEPRQLAEIRVGEAVIAIGARLTR
jgi:S1-C subfamily serine protease